MTVIIIAVLYFFTEAKTFITGQSQALSWILGIGSSSMLTMLNLSLPIISNNNNGMHRVKR